MLNVVNNTSGINIKNRDNAKIRFCKLYFGIFSHSPFNSPITENNSYYTPKFISLTDKISTI